MRKSESNPVEIKDFSINETKLEIKIALSKNNSSKALQLMHQLSEKRILILEFHNEIVKFSISPHFEIKEWAYRVSLQCFQTDPESVMMCANSVLKDLRSTNNLLKVLALDFIFQLIPETLVSLFYKDIEFYAKQPNESPQIKIKALIIFSKWVKWIGIPTDLRSFAKNCEVEKDPTILKCYLLLLDDCCKIEQKCLHSFLLPLFDLLLNSEENLSEYSLRLFEIAIQSEAKIAAKISERVLKIVSEFESSARHVCFVAFAIRVYSKNLKFMKSVILSIAKHFQFSTSSLVEIIVIEVYRNQDKLRELSGDFDELIDSLVDQPPNSNCISTLVQLLFFKSQLNITHDQFISLWRNLCASESSEKLLDLIFQQTELMISRGFEKKEEEMCEFISSTNIDFLRSVFLKSSQRPELQKYLEFIFKNNQKSAIEFFFGDGFNEQFFFSDLFLTCDHFRSYDFSSKEKFFLISSIEDFIKRSFSKLECFENIKRTEKLQTRIVIIFTLYFKSGGEISKIVSGKSYLPFFQMILFEKATKLQFDDIFLSKKNKPEHTFESFLGSMTEKSK